MTNINIESTEQAVSLLTDESLSEFDREEAADYIREYPTPEGIEALVNTLDDDDYGVHWACGTAIAQLGEIAFPTYLAALTQPNHSPRLRESARHIVHFNSSPRVKEDGKALLAAVKGPSPAVTTMEAAYRLSEKYK